MVEVMRFFDMRPADFRSEWAAQDKAQLKAGIANGSLTY